MNTQELVQIQNHVSKMIDDNVIDKLLGHAEFHASKSEYKMVRNVLNEINKRLDGQALPEQFTGRWNKICHLGDISCASQQRGTV